MDGCIFDELTDFQKDLFKEASTLFPEETDKFLKTEAKELSNYQKSIAKNLVGTSKGKKKNWKPQKSYHKRFKVGKIYKYTSDEKSIRAYNGAPHSHLIEYGHKTVNGKFVPGRHVIAASENGYKNKFLKNCETFLSEHFDENIGK